MKTLLILAVLVAVSVATTKFHKVPLHLLNNNVNYNKPNYARARFPNHPYFSQGQRAISFFNLLFLFSILLIGHFNFCSLIFYFCLYFSFFFFGFSFALFINLF